MKSFADPSSSPAATTPSRRVWWWTGAVVLLGAVVLILALTARRRQSSDVQASFGASAAVPSPSNPAEPSTHALPDFEVKPAGSEEGTARWYDVPEKSLAQRRAWPGELTAASDRLPKNTYVRVRRIDAKADPDKSVVVRITDDGVHNRTVLIDLDRDAADALGMVQAGQARVRVEVLALRNATTDKPVEKKNEAPIAPKASELTDHPTASQQQEKDAAQAKSGGATP